VGCGISRLARFNVTAAELSDQSGKVKYFEGTPIPTSVLIVLSIGWLVFRGRIGEQLLWGAWELGSLRLHPLALIYLVSGSLMVSTVRVPKI
jgi:CDP-diacylglycerol--serine O-phosphatidyltransferase